MERTIVGVERGAEGRRAVADPRFHRPDRDAQRVGDLGVRQVEVVLEDEDRPLVERQPPEGAVDTIMLDVGAGGIGGRPIAEADQ